MQLCNIYLQNGKFCILLELCFFFFQPILNIQDGRQENCRGGDGVGISLTAFWCLYKDMKSISYNIGANQSGVF